MNLARLLGLGGRRDAISDAREKSKRGSAFLDAGRLSDAVTAFRAAVDAAPQDAAHHVNLGYALQEAGASQEARAVLLTAVALNEANFDARYLLGGMLERDGDVESAVAHLEVAAALRPDFAIVHADLARVLTAAGASERALVAVERALAIEPGNSDYMLALGNVQLANNDYAAAASTFRAVLAVQPHAGAVHVNLGLALHKSEDYVGAAASFEQAILCAQDDAQRHQVHIHLAATRNAQEQPDQAQALLETVIREDPAHAEAINQLGSLHATQGRLDDAMRCYQLAIELEPDQPGAYGNLGLAYYDLGRMNDAVAMYRRSLSIKPLAFVHDNLGNALIKQGLTNEAIEQYRAALALRPDDVNTECNLAAALANDKGPRAAIDAYREILRLKPSHVIARSNLLFNLCYDGEATVEEYLSEARLFDAALSKQTLPPVMPDPRAGVERPLRVGLVSGDLLGHPVGYFVEDVLKRIDAARIELFAYSTSPIEDALTARIKPKFAHWRLIKGWPERKSAECIRADGVDVLVDLAGHSALNGLPVFAWRPAPLQLSWLGYFASTGMNAMDYVLADPVCVPPGSEWQFTERVWRLPHTRLCYTPQPDSPPVAPLPALERGYPTFGCFQRLPKINDRVLALWGQIFKALPDARLLLQSQQFVRQRYEDEIRIRLHGVGIDSDRVTVRPPAARRAYLSTYGDVDVVLDTFPYTGGTTTCEALWMGVPTLTLTGRTMLGRQGAALLSAAGLSEWVATTPDDYVERACRLTADRAALAAQRAGLREHIQSSPLLDASRFARNLEAALLAMWSQRCAEQRTLSTTDRDADKGRETASICR